MVPGVALLCTSIDLTCELPGAAVPLWGTCQGLAKDGMGGMGQILDPLNNVPGKVHDPQKIPDFKLCEDLWMGFILVWRWTIHKLCPCFFQNTEVPKESMLKILQKLTSFSIKSPVFFVLEPKNFLPIFQWWHAANQPKSLKLVVSCVLHSLFGFVWGYFFPFLRCLNHHEITIWENMVSTFFQAFEVNASLRYTQIRCSQIDDNLPGSITCCCNSLPLHLSLHFFIVAGAGVGRSVWAGGWERGPNMSASGECSGRWCKTSRSVLDPHVLINLLSVDKWPLTKLNQEQPVDKSVSTQHSRPLGKKSKHTHTHI